MDSYNVFVEIDNLCRKYSAHQRMADRAGMVDKQRLFGYIQENPVPRFYGTHYGLCKVNMKE